MDVKYKVLLRTVSSVYMNGEVQYSYGIKGLYDTLEQAIERKNFLVNRGYKNEDLIIEEG